MGKPGLVDPCLMVPGSRMRSKRFAVPSVCVYCVQGSLMPSKGGRSRLSCSRSGSKPKSPLQRKSPK